ncbi:MAG: thermonuclease family protein [Rhizobiaceae bacterium]
MAWRRSDRLRRRLPQQRGWASFSTTLVGFAALTAIIVWLDQSSSTTLSGAARIVDGDSLLVRGKSLRLMGIDAPELDQQCQLGSGPWRCGRDARSALAALIDDRQVSCRTHGHDKYQRLLAICRSNGVELNARMVETGFAVDYGGYAAEEGRARRNKLGLWRGDFDFPQEWRQANRSQSTGAPVSLNDRWQSFWSRISAIILG